MNVMNIMYAAAAGDPSGSFYTANTAGTADSFGWVAYIMCKDISSLRPSAEGRSTAKASLKML